jgi:proteasome lid subunit RPN8/RPN11
MQISLKKLELIKRYARKAYPFECCGILVGIVEHHYDLTTENIVLEVAPCQNIYQGDRRTGFEISAFEMYEITLAAHRAGLQVLGTYHSHTQTRAIPSAMDLDFLPAQHSLMILAVSGRVVYEIRSFSRMRQSIGYEDVFEEQIRLRF